VIPLGDARGGIAECLSALGRQAEAGTEILVVARPGAAAAQAIEHAFPWARVVRGPARSGAGELRAAGLAQARGEIVAFTDPCCRVGDGWMARVCAQPWERYAAVGGVVLPHGLDGAADWAAFLADYGWFLPPVPSGEVGNLPGNNVAFRRQALERAGLVGEPELWKVFALKRLSAQGERFWSDRDLRVYHQRSGSTLEHARRSYVQGRCYGGQRARDTVWGERLVRAATCPALPLVLTARVVQAVRGKPGFRAALWRSLPLLVALQTAWAWGELHGYMVGPGRACSQAT
jgi:hypothetical protein